MKHQKYSPVTCSASSEILQSQGSNSPEPQRSDQDPNTGHNHRPADAVSLQRSPWILTLASFYAVLAVGSWIILCILSFRPLTTRSYDAPKNLSVYDNNYYILYPRNEKWYQAARVIQSIAGVLTIPLTSAVCSAAAVVFVQRHGKDSNITMRKLLALADKRWTDTSLYWQLVRNPKSSSKRYFSSFLVIAIALHVLGGLVSPLQALFLSSKAIKVPKFGYPFLTSFDPFAYYGSTPSLDAIAAAAIPALSSATTKQYSQLFWRSNVTLNCDTADINCNLGDVSVALQDLIHLSDPFLSPLPNGCNTGLIRQYAPRLNSSAKATYIQPSEFPSNCTSYQYHFHYHGSIWEAEVCAPVKFNTQNLACGPWTATRDRQDVYEDLFINITIFCDTTPNLPWCFGKTLPKITLLKITAHTTAGWFELPNYMNLGVPGPLQQRDPTGLDQKPDQSQVVEKRDICENLEGYSSHYLGDMQMPGPLLSLTWAMFGPQSYLATCNNALGDLEFSNRTYANGIQYCSRRPLWQLFDFSDSLTPIPLIHGRKRNDDYTDTYSLLEWFASFNRFNSTYTSALENPWTAALYIVNEAWMETFEDASLPSSSFSVSGDHGMDTNIPTIPLIGLVVISVLLFIYLVSLLSVASYAAFVPRWTESMNGFTMMRIGSAIDDRVPLLVTYREHEISALDDLPGWVGSSTLTDNCDAANQKDEFNAANLELGSPHALRAKQKYTCYPEDCEAAQKAEAFRIRRKMIRGERIPAY